MFRLFRMRDRSAEKDMRRNECLANRLVGKQSSFVRRSDAASLLRVANQNLQICSSLCSEDIEEIQEYRESRIRSV